MKNNNNQSGQTLLIIVMLLATALTVVLSVAFKTTTDTQITKLEEESQKALAASEAAIEKTINENTGTDVLNFSQIGVTFPGINSTASTIEINEFPKDDTLFVTPLLQQDEQYTFYLTDYNITSRALGTAYWSGNLIIYFKSSSDTPALELTYIDINNIITKSVIDPGGKITGTNKTDFESASYTKKSVGFSYRSVQIPITNKRLLIVRSLFAGTRIGFEGSANLRSQGIARIPNTILNTGASKKINFFQSYPQFPSGPLINLFVTSF